MKITSLKNIQEKPVPIQGGNKYIFSLLSENLPLIGGCLLALSIPVMIYLRKK